jgi:hypothetical protein
MNQQEINQLRGEINQLRGEINQLRTVYEEAYNVATACGYITKLTITLNNGDIFTPESILDGENKIGFYNHSHPARQATRLDIPTRVHFSVRWNINGKPLARTYEFTQAVAANIIKALKNPEPSTQVPNFAARPGIPHPNGNYEEGAVVWILLDRYVNQKHDTNHSS